MQHFSNLLALSEAAEEYYKRYGKSPDKELKELVKSNLIKEIPADIYGGEYYYDEEDRIVKTTTQGDRNYTRKKEEKAKKKAEEATKGSENKEAPKEETKTDK